MQTCGLLYQSHSRTKSFGKSQYVFSEDAFAKFVIDTSALLNRVGNRSSDHCWGRFGVVFIPVSSTQHRKPIRRAHIYNEDCEIIAGA